MKRYFYNIWTAILGRTGFKLFGGEPETWYKISRADGVQLGFIRTDKHGHFIPFAQTKINFNWIDSFKDIV